MGWVGFRYENLGEDLTLYKQLAASLMGYKYDQQARRPQFTADSSSDFKTAASPSFESIRAITIVPSYSNCSASPIRPHS